MLWQTHWSSWTIQEECPPNVCWIYQLKWFSFLMDLPMAELIKLAKMAGVMHEADHAYSIWSTWWLHRLATDVPFIACVINSPCTFNYYLALSNFILEPGLSYFRVLIICLLLVYFVSAVGCHCFDWYVLVMVVVKVCQWLSCSIVAIVLKKNCVVGLSWWFLWIC